MPRHDPVITEIGQTRGTVRHAPDPRAIAQAWRARAESENLSIRQLVIAQERQRGFVGSPATVAEELIRWVRTGASDGFNITPWIVPGGLDDVVDTLVPELQERGAYRTEYTGSTLRDHLGLRDPLTRRAPTPVGATV
ncbi:hypothetical protein [Cellulomonas sp.]|uniref:hypothetical protein n=1 Tax=Cellulomonas sp. TaxID=40001 RepID=UPI003BAD66D9